MAAFHGKGGYVTFGAVIANVLSWSIEATCDVAEGTVMDAELHASGLAATFWKYVMAGFKTWTATVECNFTSTGLDPDLATDFWDENGASLVLYETIANALTGNAEGRKYTGTALVTGISVSVDKDEVEKVTYEFQGNAAFTIAASDYTPA